MCNYLYVLVRSTLIHTVSVHIDLVGILAREKQEFARMKESLEARSGEIAHAAPLNSMHTCINYPRPARTERNNQCAIRTNI